MIKGCEFTKQNLNEKIEALEFAQKLHLAMVGGAMSKLLPGICQQSE